MKRKQIQSEEFEIYYRVLFDNLKYKSLLTMFRFNKITYGNGKL